MEQDGASLKSGRGFEHQCPQPYSQVGTGAVDEHLEDVVVKVVFVNVIMVVTGVEELLDDVDLLAEVDVTVSVVEVMEVLEGVNFVVGVVEVVAVDEAVDVLKVAPAPFVDVVLDDEVLEATADDEVLEAAGDEEVLEVAAADVEVLEVAVADNKVLEAAVVVKAVVVAALLVVVVVTTGEVDELPAIVVVELTDKVVVGELGAHGCAS